MSLNLVHQIYKSVLCQLGGGAFVFFAAYRLVSTYNVHLMIFWNPENRPGLDTLFEHYPSLFIEVLCYVAMGIVLFLSGRRGFKKILQEEEMAILHSKMDSIKSRNRGSGTLILTKHELEEPPTSEIDRTQTASAPKMSGFGIETQKKAQNRRTTRKDTGTILLTKEELGEKRKFDAKEINKNTGKGKGGSKNLKNPRPAPGGSANTKG